jgi:hypothetical protein
VNVDPARLQPGTVPMVCAKTGEPTTLLRHHLLWRTHKVVWWSWLLWSFPLVWIYKVAKGDGRHVVLPISSATLLKARLALAARCVGTFLVLVVWFSDDDGILNPLLLSGSLAVLVALFKVTARVWVAPRWTGSTVRLREPHWNFREAIEGMTGRPAYVMPQVPSFAPDPAPEPEPVATGPVPGWYPDPGGQHAARFFDGERWTEQVA